MPTMTVVTNTEMTKKGAQVRCLIFSAPGVHPSLEPYPPECSNSLATLRGGAEDLPACDAAIGPSCAGKCATPRLPTRYSAEA